MTFLFAFICFIIGFIFGWGSRSFQFVADKDCANPEHETPHQNED